MNNCGLMLESGFEGMPSDVEKASLLYRQAHKLGNLDSTINLAFYYLNVSESLQNTQLKHSLCVSLETRA